MFSLVLLPLFPLIRDGESSNTFANSARSEISTRGDVTDGWKRTEWEDHRECRIVEVCLDDEQYCESNMTLKNLENEEELVIIDLTKDYIHEIRGKIKRGVLKSYIEEICDIAFVTTGDSEDCMVIRTQNRCKWKAISENYCSNVKTMDLSPTEDVPKDCTLSPGWTGMMMNTTRRQDGTYKLNWPVELVSSILSPGCVHHHSCPSRTQCAIFWDVFSGTQVHCFNIRTIIFWYGFPFASILCSNHHAVFTVPGCHKGNVTDLLNVTFENSSFDLSTDFMNIILCQVNYDEFLFIFKIFQGHITLTILLIIKADFHNSTFSVVFPLGPFPPISDIPPCWDLTPCRIGKCVTAFSISDEWKKRKKNKWKHTVDGVQCSWPCYRDTELNLCYQQWKVSSGTQGNLQCQNVTFPPLWPDVPVGESLPIRINW